MLTGAIEAPKRLEDLHVRRDLVASLLLRTIAFADQLSGAAIETRLDGNRMNTDAGDFAEWKRQDESDKGKVDAEALLDGMLAHDRLLDIVENFILFDESKAGKTRKIVARTRRHSNSNTRRQLTRHSIGFDC